MADEVPVCDVLCEAMEYLSKLGTNLRARSENLKEKRIRKDKLKNNHAVQKAADKVLLICELSKKSLENVECGVRKILTLLSASQGPRAPGRDVAGSSTNAHQDQDKYRYFKYRSYKLKVAKKVPVKHYMSVRVLARNMSLSMHDKYPVYHNCKLYRSRKRKEQARKSVENIKNCEEKKSNKVEPNKTDGVHDSNSDTGDIEESRQMPKDNEALTSKMSPKSTLDNSNKHKENEDVCDVKEMSGSCNRSEEIVKSRKSSLCSNKSEGSSKTEGMNNDSQHSDNEESGKKSKKHSKRKLSLSRRKSNSDNDSDNDSMLRKRKSSKVLTKKIQVIDDDSSDDKSQEDCVKNKYNESEELEKLNKCETNKEECNNSQNLSNLKSTNLDEKQDDVEKVADTSQEENNDVEQSESVPVKPMIKCVNINKLLKPDIAENVVVSPKKESKSRTEKISESTKKRKVISTSDEKFWEQKRKEVSAFIPKKFVINVIRLPRLSQRFLHLHGLRRIVQNDKTISELQTENGNKAVEAENLKCDSSKKSSAETLNVVKNALLNDSDSDKSDGSKSPLPLAEIEKTVQNVLHDVNPAMDSTLQSFEELNRTIEKVLKDSAESDHKTKDDDVGKESSHESTTNNTEKLKNALLNDSDSDNSKGTEKSTENEKSCKEKSPLKETDLKQTLLAGSDSENTEHNRTNSNMQDNNSSKSNKVDEIATESSQCNNPAPDAGLEISPIKKKKHKRKSMMESMHAKKMLLNYSSSSDTEDEQLKNAFKQIKDALLKGASSSDDEKKKKDAQGSSEDDMISRKSKRKHLRCSNDEDSDKGSRGLKVNPNTSDHTSEQSRKKGHSKRSKKKVRFE